MRATARARSPSAAATASPCLAHLLLLLIFGPSPPFLRLVLFPAAVCGLTSWCSTFAHMLLASRHAPRWAKFSPSASHCVCIARLAAHLLLSVLAFLCLYNVLTIFFSVSTAVWASDVRTLLTAWHQDPARHSHTVYPTSFTRDIRPIPIHSHNDYWRPVPLYSALSVGAVSVEADVWEYDGELFVGHDVGSLTRNRTFKNLYIDPLVEILARQNLQTEFSNGTNHGVFDQVPEQTLHLFVDLKTPGAQTFAVVQAHLESLRSPHNYLTHYNGTHVVPGAITVHGTGNTPFDLLVANTTYRDIFYDAPLPKLLDASSPYDSTNTLIASTSFGKSVGRLFWPRKDMTPEMVRTVQEQVDAAHKQGIMARYWSTPSWPIGLRNTVWRRLVAAGVDLLNVDDLKAAAYMDWSA